MAASQALAQRASASRRRRRILVNSRVAPILVGLATIAVLLAIWQFCVGIGWWSKLIAPAPTAIADGFGPLFAEEGLVLRFLQTLGETVAAALLAIAAGVPIGLW